MSEESRVVDEKENAWRVLRVLGGIALLSFAALGILAWGGEEVGVAFFRALMSGKLCWTLYENGEALMNIGGGYVVSVFVGLWVVMGMVGWARWFVRNPQPQTRAK